MALESQGTFVGAPFGTNVDVGTARREIRDISLGMNPFVFQEEFEDFNGVTVEHYQGPMINNVSNADTAKISVTNTNTAVINFPIRRAGVVTSLIFTGNTALATSDTNYVTWTATNLGPANAGTTALLATSPAGVNTTKATGGTAIAANTPYTLTLSSTAANLAVVPGDVVQVVVTTTGTLANIVDAPAIIMGVASIGTSRLWTPFAFRTAGSPSISRVANTVGGVAAITLSATSEAQTAGISWGDALNYNKPDAGATNVNARSIPNFQCFFSIPTAITTAQKVLIGLGTAMNATATSITKGVALQLDASMSCLLTARDGTNTNNSTTPSKTLTLTAGSWYKLTISLSDPTAAQFFITAPGAPAKLLGTLTMAALASTDGLQPFVYLQKASGTTTPSIQVDYLLTRQYRANIS